MQKRKLGTAGLEVSAIGLGCMTMTGGYGVKPDRDEMIQAHPRGRRAWRHLLRYRGDLRRPVHQRGTCW